MNINILHSDSFFYSYLGVSRLFYSVFIHKAIIASPMGGAPARPYQRLPSRGEKRNQTIMHLKGLCFVYSLSENVGLGATFLNYTHFL